MKKCSPPMGIPYRPDGKNELDPCRYEAVEAWKNVTVMVLKCKKCGHEELIWYKQDDSEQINPNVFDKTSDVPKIGGSDAR